MFITHCMVAVRRYRHFYDCKCTVFVTNYNFSYENVIRTVFYYAVIHYLYIPRPPLIGV